jgi:hypothetical protein
MKRTLTVGLLVWTALSLCSVDRAFSGGPMESSSVMVQTGAGKAHIPQRGSPERKAILDAVRKKLNIKSQFEVHHIKVNQRWAYFRGGEVFFIEGEKQETDLSVAVLLERKEKAGKPSWTVAEIWTLPTNDDQSFQTFVERVRQRQKAESIPNDIFPDDM